MVGTAENPHHVKVLGDFSKSEVTSSRLNDLAEKNWVLENGTDLKDVQILNLSNNNIDSEIGLSVNRLALFTKLHTLNLSYNMLGAEGCKNLAGALSTNTTITTLKLENNGIEEGDESIDCLLRALQTNHTLTEMQLGAQASVEQQGFLTRLLSVNKKESQESKDKIIQELETWRNAEKFKTSGNQRTQDGAAQQQKAATTPPPNFQGVKM